MRGEHFVANTVRTVLASHVQNKIPMCSLGSESIQIS